MIYLSAFSVILIASFLFAMLGLGGGMIYVPVLKWLGYSVKEVAIPLGLLLNGLNTLLALIPYSKSRLVDWKGGAAMAIAALIASPIGAYTSGYVPVRLLLIFFAAAVLAAAIRMSFFAKNPEPKEKISLKKRAIIGVLVGGFAGFVGGMLGLGGGFIIAPILMWMGYKTKEAAATTAFVVTFSSFSGYLGHMAEGHFYPLLTAMVVLAVLIGSQLGATFMSKKAKPSWVKKAYAVVLFVVAIKLIIGIII